MHNFYNIYVIYKHGCGLHDKTWQSIGWRPIVQNITATPNDLVKHFWNAFFANLITYLSPFGVRYGYKFVTGSQDSIVSVVTILWIRKCTVQFLVWSRNFSPCQKQQAACSTHPASYPVSVRDSFPAGKVAVKPCLLPMLSSWNSKSPCPPTSSQHDVSWS
jgi:hypothetical protein